MQAPCINITQFKWAKSGLLYTVYYCIAHWTPNYIELCSSTTPSDIHIDYLLNIFWLRKCMLCTAN